jgi:hypothetical protein
MYELEKSKEDKNEGILQAPSTSFLGSNLY